MPTYVTTVATSPPTSMLNMDPCLVVDTFDGANALESSKNNDHCSADVTDIQMSYNGGMIDCRMCVIWRCANGSYCDPHG